jgi:shikimate kinase
MIGMPGAGKTYWGRCWAEAQGWQFTDLDALVEVMEGTTVAHLFETRGEMGFRDAETRALDYLIARPLEQTLVACGGGTPCFAGNMERMLSKGCVVYLRASVSTLVLNLSRDPHSRRPLLAGEHPEAQLFLERLLQQRGAFYEKAHQTVDVENLTPATFAQILDACTNPA